MISFLTDNPSNLTASGLLLSDDESWRTEIGPGQFVRQLQYEQRYAGSESLTVKLSATGAGRGDSRLWAGDENAQLHASVLCALCRHSYRMMLEGCILKRNQ